MKGNNNVSVLTTYTDVDSIISKASNEQHTLLTQAEHNIYA